MCYPTPVSTRATYFQAAFDAGVVDNSRKGLLLTEGASEVQGFTGTLCIHLLNTFFTATVCHRHSLLLCWLSSNPKNKQGWFGSGVNMADAHSQRSSSRFIYSSTDVSLHMALVTRSKSLTRHFGALSRAGAR